MKKCVLLLCAVVSSLFLPSTSFAHSVYIFAWVDGTQICTESYFTQSSKVRGGEVLMTDQAGGILARGVTGEDGLLCFALPATPQTLEFTVNAGSGHRGRFKLEEKELAGALGLQEPIGQNPVTDSAQRTPPEQERPAIQTANTSDDPLPLGLVAGSEDIIRRIVQEEIQKQLSPMRQYLAEKLENKSPGLRDIVGGIGWLAGLGAFGFWLSQKRKRL